MGSIQAPKTNTHTWASLLSCTHCISGRLRIQAQSLVLHEGRDKQSSALHVRAPLSAHCHQLLNVCVSVCTHAERQSPKPDVQTATECRGRQIPLPSFSVSNSPSASSLSNVSFALPLCSPPPRSLLFHPPLCNFYSTHTAVG